MRETFSRAAQWTSKAAGKAPTFILALAAILGWAVTGPMFGYSDTWQLVINTGTTIVTFLMVFLIQHTQNRDTQAIHIKLDELILATEKARNSMMALEEMDEEVLEQMKRAVVKEGELS